MLTNSPTVDDLSALLGKSLYNVWQELCDRINEKYEIECVWNKGFKDWIYELKFRRGGKLFVHYMQNKK